MARVYLLLAALALALSLTASVQPCAAGVLCCCRTFNGGTCCAQVPICGEIIPGCLCGY